MSRPTTRSKNKKPRLDNNADRSSEILRCSKCGKDSEASSKIEDFYELELNVMGLKSLGESLDDYLNVEELNGENQYFCDSCSERVDATRSIKLRSLPAVLNIQLKRCVFLPKTTTKKKITSAFSFPRELDMTERLSDPAQGDLVYDLSAVLIHKGTAVNSGHYIAHIKDEKTGQWWEFDDESVSKLGCHPFGEGSSKTMSRDSQTEPSAQTSNGDTKSSNAKKQSSETAVSNTDETFSSTDAYMLMYNLRHSKINRLEKPINGNSADEDDFASISNGNSIPPYLSEEISNSNATLTEACQQYKLRKEKESDHITERRQEVRSVLSEAPVQSCDEPYFWISMNWLREWADNITPSVLDNTTVQCLHGKLPMSKVSSAKRLSAEAWLKLFTKYNGGPALGNQDYCKDCLIDAARKLVSGESYRDRRKLMKEIAESVLSGNCSDGTYYVSKAWLQQWVKRKVLDAPSEADVGPTVPICCPHGQLMPEQASGAKRLLVPENLWLFFYEDAVKVKSDDMVDCPTFTMDSEQCSQCSNELSEVACMEDSLRAMKSKQRQNHDKLAAAKSIPLSPHCTYYLLPSSWLATWRNYVNASSKNVSSSEVPESLNVVIDQLKCEKHSHLVERPLDLVYKRGTIFQKVSSTDGLTIITENDWKCFCEEWGCSQEKGISAMIECPDSAHSNADSSKETSVCEEQLNSHDEANDRYDDKQLVIKTSPEVCEDCIGERASCELMRKLNYVDQDIHVVFIQGKEVPRSILEASETSSDPDRRSSKRSRKTNSGNAINLKVSGSTSVYQLKMMIWESLGVVKENQIIHKGHTKIDGESGTLADFNIFPGDTLWVRDSKIHEHRDIADEIAGDKMDVQSAEEGFRGTLLTADFSSQVV
ncbi:ubiquitin carboxyl-terminal hydrolase 26 isoform X2 [Punica granatum]|uniref:ubiquitinyl hydrolase 1 n=1 Tax=Punica granatum TaxID=22663 RepID=A0A6P8CD16_PUNGR|nr:ubiquitin carboxyl-terminal hydrolase 26 isoform X2 [Punica granatum]XP_031381799.1 ubiquitin carboxyl-terminal hydrolase 26 isoform X2 [Punica granatum]